jgi:hypothetical protein
LAANTGSICEKDDQRVDFFLCVKIIHRNPRSTGQCMVELSRIGSFPAVLEALYQFPNVREY